MCSIKCSCSQWEQSVIFTYWNHIGTIESDEIVCSETKGLTGYCFNYTDTPFCLQANEMTYGTAECVIRFVVHKIH